jgi:uncharacterized membrane protein YgdD (TMEM256/DUF423 family)
MGRKFLITGTVFMLTGILFGAFGAHSLKSLVEVEKLATFETGIRYQFYMGLSFLIFGLKTVPDLNLKMIYRMWLIGGCLFSGSIYLLALQALIGLELKFLGPITPIGGLVLIIGWGMLLVQLIGVKKNN